MNSKNLQLHLWFTLRGLLIAFELFQIIKKEIPNIKFKIFSSFLETLTLHTVKNIYDN